MRDWLTRNRRLWPALGVVLGAVGGYAYYHFIGCASGHCPLTSNPYISTGFGALIGGLATWDSDPAADRSRDSETPDASQGDA